MKPLKFKREAVIMDVQKKKIKDLTDQELKNHGYNSLGDMIDSHRIYYGPKVNLQSEVKVITFKLLK